MNIIAKLKEFLFKNKDINEEIIDVDIETMEEDKMVLEYDLENMDKGIQFRRKLRTNTFYRNYPNKKLMRIVKRQQRPSYLKYMKKYKLEDIENKIIVENSKYNRGTNEAQYFDKLPLPNVYYTNEIVLMPKNPNTLFAYWEIKEEKFLEMKEKFNIKDDLIIKILKGNEEIKRIIRKNRIGSHYINDVYANEVYKVELGFEDYQGIYHLVAESTEVIAPTDKISDNLSVRWGMAYKEEETGVVRLHKYTLEELLALDDEEFAKLIKEDLHLHEAGESIINEIVHYREINLGASENMVISEIEKITKNQKIGSSGKII